MFNLGFDKNIDNTKTHWTYFPDKSINFYRVGYYSNILGFDCLSMYIEIGFKEDAIVDLEKQLELTLENLKKCGIIILINNIGGYFIVNDTIYGITGQIRQ